MPRAPHVPDLRIAARNPRPVRRDGEYVLYWMVANRRTAWNFALDRALEHALALERPLLVFEPLRAGYRWASDRLHRFVLDGMRDNAAACEHAGVAYLPYVEPEPGAGRGLLEALAQRACVVVTDDWPCFFVPNMVASAASRLPVLLEAVDANGLLPVRAAESAFPTAYAFRRFLQRTLRPHLDDRPLESPLAHAAALPGRAEVAGALARDWPRASDAMLAGADAALAALPIDHTVPVAPTPGGSAAAARALAEFVRHRLPRYAEERSEPDSGASSGFSPWLHFGHLSTHQVLAAISRTEGWTPERTARTANGKKSGWWNLPASAEAFLDELVTWRELGFNCTSQRDDYDRYESLPAWARSTLEQHARDVRPHLYSLEEFERAETHDPLWNAAQRELVREGRIHNYMRMLWGKKVLEWTRSPREALDVLIELNNRYALDGRDPNSYSGIFWTLGRYDRPWGPVREVFGTVRYMSSENTARNLDVRAYLRKLS